MKLTAIVCALILSAALPPASAQIVTGSIVGTVQDPGGLAVPAAKATLTQVQTGRQRSLETG